MLPLKDDNKLQTIPVFTIGLIAANCLVFYYQITLPPRLEDQFLFRFGLIPIALTHLHVLAAGTSFPIWLTPLTSMFLHGDLWHLLGNMLYLWIFGNNVEDYLGHFKFLAFYLLSGLAAVALFVTLNPDGRLPLVGASGAIAGILGAYLVAFPRSRVLTLIWILFFIRMVWLPAVFLLGYWIVLQIVMAAATVGSSTDGGVAWSAHVGGFAFGWIIMRLFKKRLAATRHIAVDTADYYGRWH